MIKKYGKKIGLDRYSCTKDQLKIFLFLQYSLKRTYLTARNNIFHYRVFIAIVMGILICPLKLLMAQAPNSIQLQAMIHHQNSNEPVQRNTGLIKVQYIVGLTGHPTLQSCVVKEEAFCAAINKGYLKLRLGNGTNLPGSSEAPGAVLDCASNVKSTLLVTDFLGSSNLFDIMTVNNIADNSTLCLNNSGQWVSRGTDALTIRPDARYVRLEIPVSTDVTLTPIFNLDSVPFAMSSQYAKLAGSIGADAVETTSIKNNAVTTAKILNGAVTTDKILNGAVTTDKILNDAVTTDKILNDAVTTDKILNGAVTGGKIADGSITAAKLHSSLSLGSTHLADDSVITSKILNGAVTNAKLSSDAVATGNIQNNAVTNAKLSSDAVATGNIQNNAVTNAKLSSNAVATGNIQDNAVTSGKIADSAISTSKLMSNPGRNRIVKTDNTDGSSLQPLSCGTGELLLWQDNTVGWVCFNPAFNLANGIVRLDGTSRLPAVDGSQLTNLPKQWSEASGGRIFYDTASVGIGTNNPGTNTRLDVAGQIVSRSSTQNSQTINFGSSNNVISNYDCNSGSINLQNIRDGGNYILVITGTGITQCNFNTTTTGDDAATVSYRFMPANSTRLANSHTLYQLTRIGSVIYITWVSGFVP